MLPTGTVTFLFTDVEVSTHGHAFFAVFAEPGDAVHAARSAQSGLQGGAVRVRMGLHMGAAVLADRTYVGMDVNRAARIGDAAHGGQVLVSAAVAERLGGPVARRGGVARSCGEGRA